jgi:hypothetical protein
MNKNTRLNQIPGIEKMSMMQVLTLAAQAVAMPGDRAELEAFRRAQQPKETGRQELERLRAEASQREARQLAALAAEARQEARDFVLGR